ncbi:arsenate reductase/protein-tyrosine-phosphatase family protein [Stutzerimonas tarimensis]|uniref:protein-tyrosine-phosphatase n=1 Tax=Stutzerimonas tarimensis TaxID=1507735 RepID=A0ABV7T787_9GAMM
MRVLSVCLDNICRSPTAEGVFRQRPASAGLEASVHVESAGIGDYGEGDGFEQELDLIVQASDALLTEAGGRR